MGRIGSERFAVTDVTLRPVIAFGGATKPSAEQIAALHEAAHERCFIANSVKTAIRVEPRS
jgi:organic hydroperoxide reductase OsmC/OhrA